MPRRSGNARRRTSRDSRRSGASRSSRTRRTSRSAVRRRRFRAEEEGQETAPASRFRHLDDKGKLQRLTELYNNLNADVKLKILDTLFELNKNEFIRIARSALSSEGMEKWNETNRRLLEKGKRGRPRYVSPEMKENNLTWGDNFNVLYHTGGNNEGVGRAVDIGNIETTTRRPK